MSSTGSDGMGFIVSTCHYKKNPIVVASIPLTIALLLRYDTSMIELNIDTSEFMDFFRQNDVKVIGIFGSAARGEATYQSDIDLLVEFSKRKSLLDLVALERKISAIFGKKVDLLTEAALSPYLRERIKKDLHILYEA